MSHRERELLEAVDNLTKVHNEWVDDPNRPNPDAEYWDAVDELLEAFAGGSMPASCRQLAESVELLREAVEQFDDRPGQDNGYPQDGFWAARQRIEDVRRGVAKPQKKPMESIKDLCALPNMSHEQVARMWNFLDPRGTPMPWLVQRELDKPGSVTNSGKEVVGPHWRHPDEPEASAEEESRVENLAVKSERARRDAAPCPETPQQLWEQGVSVEQSARMLRKPEAEVRKLFEQFEAERAGEVDSGEPAATSEQEPQQLLGGEPESPKASDAEIEQKVIEMHLAGESNAAIKQALGIHGNKIVRTIKRHQQESQPATA